MTRPLAAPAFLKRETVMCLIDGLSANGFQKLVNVGVFEKTGVNGRVPRDSVELKLGRKITNEMYLDACALVEQRRASRKQARQKGKEK
ncbi:MAG: hypothetical protein LBK60_00290 [Verrucomicrobiales bacterium]|nr:hypothetical protein [Verrucomicrobiales bacterium]